MSRSGRTGHAIAGAAYRAGENLRLYKQGEHDPGKTFRYSNRQDVVRETFIMNPEGETLAYLTTDGEPTKAELRQQRMDLWNDIEVKEKSNTARLGREVQLGFAYELSHDDQRELVKDFVRCFATEGGEREVKYQVKTKDGKTRIETRKVEMRFVADVAIHNYGKRVPFAGASEAQLEKIRGWARDSIPFVSAEEARAMEIEHVRENRDRHGNVTSYQKYQPHSHVRISPRVVVDGQWAKDKFASRVLNDDKTTMAMRYGWARMQNGYLERAGSDVRVTCTPEDLDEFPVHAREEKQDQVTRNIEERLSEQPAQKQENRAEHQARNEEAKATIAANDEFKELHKESKRELVVDQMAEAGGDAEPLERQYRITEWYRNVGRRLDNLRDAVPEKAAQWRERLKGMKPRLRAWFGYDPPDKADTGQEVDPSKGEQHEPEPDR